MKNYTNTARDIFCKCHVQNWVKYNRGVWTNGLPNTALLAEMRELFGSYQ